MVSFRWNWSYLHTKNRCEAIGCPGWLSKIGKGNPGKPRSQRVPTSGQQCASSLTWLNRAMGL